MNFYWNFWIFVTSNKRDGVLPIYGKWACLWPDMGAPQRHGFLGGLKLITLYNFYWLLVIQRKIFYAFPWREQGHENKNTNVYASAKPLIRSFTISTFLYSQVLDDIFVYMCEYSNIKNVYTWPVQETKWSFLV